MGHPETTFPKDPEQELTEPTVNTPALARHIRAVRFKKGWTQQHLADSCGLAVSTICTAEAGKPISVTSRRRIVDIVGDVDE